MYKKTKLGPFVAYDPNIDVHIVSLSILLQRPPLGFGVYSLLPQPQGCWDSGTHIRAARLAKWNECS